MAGSSTGALRAALARITAKREAEALELNRADAEGLRALLAERDAAVATSRDSAEAAERELAAARHVLGRLEAQRPEEALREHAELLEQRLVETVDQLRALCGTGWAAAGLPGSRRGR